MMDNIYIFDMTTRTKPDEIARAVADARRGAIAGVEPSPLRHAVASAIVRFGVFLNGRAYHCPGAPDRWAHEL